MSIHVTNAVYFCVFYMYCNTLYRNKRGLFPKDYAATEEMKSVLSTTTPMKDKGSSNRMTSASLGTKASITMIFIFRLCMLKASEKYHRQFTSECSDIQSPEVHYQTFLSVKSKQARN